MKLKAIAKITWIGKSNWSGHLCKKHLDEFWENNKHLVSLQFSDIILENSDQLYEHHHKENENA